MPNGFTPRYDWEDYPSEDTIIMAADLLRHELGIAAAGRVWRRPLTSGLVRTPLMLNSDAWIFVEADKIYFVPVPYFGDTPGGTFGVSNFGVAFRGDVGAGTAYVGLYDDSNGGLPGVPVAQGTVATSVGWKDIDITNVTGLPYGWYWHAVMCTDGLDVYGGRGLGYFDAASIEHAVRDGEQKSSGFITTGTHASLTTNPAVVSIGGVVPRVGVQFV